MRASLLLWFIQVRSSYSSSQTKQYQVLRVNTNVLGWVPSTDIGSGIEEWVQKNAPNFPRVTQHDSAVGCVKVFETVTIEKTNLFWNYDGTNLPW